METKEERAFKDLERALKIIRAYESFEGQVEHAMHKVGWNNSRIEEAFDELKDKLKEIG